MRDETSLINKFKKIMQELKAHAGWQRRNAMRTGGGPAEPKPAHVKLEVTGALLQLQQIYGHAMSGMDGYDCDSISKGPKLQILLPSSNAIRTTLEQIPSISVTSTATDAEGIHSSQVATQPSIRSIRQQSRVNDLLANFVDDSEVPIQIMEFDPIRTSSPFQNSNVGDSNVLQRTETIVSTPAETAKPITTTTVLPTTTTPMSQQFFPTNAQQQTRRRQNRSRATETSENANENRPDLVELRRQFIMDEREHYRKEHVLSIEHRRSLLSARLNAISSENAERLAEMRTRRRFLEAIAAKQSLFWDAAIAAINAPTAHQAQHVQRVVAIANTVNRVEEVNTAAENTDDVVNTLARATDNNANDSTNFIEFLNESFDQLTTPSEQSASLSDNSHDEDYMP